MWFNDFILAMADYLFLIISFMFIIFFHELGHWIMFKIQGYEVKSLKFNKIGDLEIGKEVHNKISLWKAMLVSVGGITLGFLPLYISKFFIISQSFFLLMFVMYCFMCFGDLTMLFLIINTKNKKQTLMDLNVSLWKDYVDEMRKAGEKIDYT